MLDLPRPLFVGVAAIVATFCFSSVAARAQPAPPLEEPPPMARVDVQLMRSTGRDSIWLEPADQPMLRLRRTFSSSVVYPPPLCVAPCSIEAPLGRYRVSVGRNSPNLRSPNVVDIHSRGRLEVDVQPIRGRRWGGGILVFFSSAWVASMWMIFFQFGAASDSGGSGQIVLAPLAVELVGVAGLVGGGLLLRRGRRVQVRFVPYFQ